MLVELGIVLWRYSEVFSTSDVLQHLVVELVLAYSQDTALAGIKKRISHSSSHSSSFWRSACTGIWSSEAVMK